MKAGDLIKIKNVGNYNGKPFTVGRLVEIDTHSVKVIIDGIGGYFIFSKDHIEGVIEEGDEDAIQT